MNATKVNLIRLRRKLVHRAILIRRVRKSGPLLRIFNTDSEIRGKRGRGSANSAKDESHPITKTIGA